MTAHSPSLPPETVPASQRGADWPAARPAVGGHDKHAARCFLLGLGGMTFIRLIGYVTFTEVYFLLSAPARFGKHLQVLTRGVPRTVVILWLCWMGSAALSDFLNGVQFQLFARGFSRAFFTGLSLLSLLLICRQNFRKLDFVLLGIPCSMVISLFYFRPGQVEVHGKQFEDLLNFTESLNYILGAAIIAICAWLYEKRPYLVLATLFAAAPLFIILGSRSAGAMFFLAGVTTLAFRLLAAPAQSRRCWVGVPRLVGISCICLAGVAAVTSAYKYAATHNLLTEDAARKYERESQAKGGVLAGGRGVYLITGLLAWADKPLLGHGSWPEDTQDYYHRACDAVGVKPLHQVQRTGQGYVIRRLIPVHSMIVGALVEHGLPAFLFFAYIMWKIVFSITFIPTLLPRYTALFSLLYWFNLWNLVASPQSHRIPMTAAWVFFLLAYEYRTASAAKGSIRARVLMPQNDRFPELRASA